MPLVTVFDIKPCTELQGRHALLSEQLIMKGRILQNELHNGPLQNEVALWPEDVGMPVHSVQPLYQLGGFVMFFFSASTRQCILASSSGCV